MTVKTLIEARHSVSYDQQKDSEPATACSVKRAELPRGKPIRVNGVVIPRSQIALETQNHPAAKPTDAWLAAARALVVRELLLQEARRLAIVPVPDIDADGRRETDDEAIVRQLIEQEVRTPEPDAATCRRIYDQQSDRFRSADLYVVHHILIAAAPGDKATRQSARSLAETLIAELSREPQRFGALAEMHSACPSRMQEGQLGQISRGQTVPEFEAALASAPIGVVSPLPVETRYGVHVVMVDQRLSGRQLPFELVQGRIADWLDDRARHTAIRQYIGLLAGRANIEGIGLEQHDSPLVQ